MGLEVGTVGAVDGVPDPPHLGAGHLLGVGCTPVHVKFCDLPSEHLAALSEPERYQVAAGRGVDQVEQRGQARALAVVRVSVDPEGAGDQAGYLSGSGLAAPVASRHDVEAA